MRYTIVNRGDPLSQKLAQQFRAVAHRTHLLWDEQMPDVVVAIGGDGTMLHAFHQFQQSLLDTAFVGIHTGHLGFYSDWNPDELVALTDLMTTHTSIEKLVVKYPLLHVEIQSSHQTASYLALNECTLKGTAATLVADVCINDTLFESFRGDGLCMSTPSGSTAYNKSLNGALLHPALEAIQLTEIASINNRVYRTIGSPIILPKHHYCDILPKRQPLLLSIDHLTFPFDEPPRIRCTVADTKVNFVRYRPFPFWDRVREAFLQDHFVHPTPTPSSL